MIDRLRNRVGGRGPRRVVAVDMDRREMRICQGVRRGKRVRPTRLLRLPPAAANVEDPEKLGELLAGQIESAGLRGALAMALPRSEAVLKPLTLPAGTQEAELPGMVRYQMEKDLAFRPEEAVIDFAVSSAPDKIDAGEEEPGGVEVVAAAVRASVVERYRQIARAAGTKLEYLALRPFCDLRCIRAYHRPETQGLIGLLHVTSGEVEVSVLAARALVLSRSIALSEQPPDANPQAPPADTIERIALAAHRTVQSFQAMGRDRQVKEFLVAGGTGLESAVAEKLQARLGIESHPFRIDGLQADEADEATALISAVGLAVVVCDRRPLAVDFLHPKRPRSPRNTRPLRTGGLIAAAGLAMAAAIGTGHRHLAGKRTRIQALQAQLTQLKAQDKQVRALARRVQAIESWVGERRCWLDDLAQLSSLLPPCQRAYVTSLKTHGGDEIRFTIRASHSEVIGNLCRRLGEAGYKPSAGQLTTGNDPYGLDYPYATEIKLIVPRGMELDPASIDPQPRPEDDDSANALAGKDGG